MSFSQIDAELASLNSIDSHLDAELQKYEDALVIISDIEKYGITIENFTQLQELYPDLTQPEIELSSIPMRLGADKIGNEALAGLSTAATVGLITALATVLGWILSKIFGGSSSGGSGGGLGRGGVADKLDSAKIPYLAKVLVDGIDDEIKSKNYIKGTKPHDKALAKQSRIRTAAIALEAINNGSTLADIKVLHDLIKDIVDLVTSEVDPGEIVKIAGKSIPGEYNRIIGGLDYFDDARKKHITMSVHNDIDDLSKARQNEFKDMTPYFTPLFHQYTGKYPAEADINIGRMVSVQRALQSFRGDLDKMIAQLTAYKGKASKHNNSINGTLKILLGYVKSTQTKTLAHVYEQTNVLCDEVIKGCLSILSVFDALTDEQKKDVLDEAGLTSDDVSKIRNSIRRKDLDANMKAVDLLNAMSKKLTLSDAQKQKLATIAQDALK